MLVGLCYLYFKLVVAVDLGERELMGTVLVTGASGFIGAVTCAALRQDGWTVRGTVRNHADYSGLITVGDIGAMTVADWLPILTGVDVIVHLAGRAHVLKETMANPLTEFRRVNTEGTRCLMSAAEQAGVRRFVFVSSIGVNGDVSGAQGFTEDSLVNPHKPYAVSKYEAEVLLRSMAAQSGLELVVVRPPLVYGAGVKGNFAKLQKLVAKGIPLPVGLANNRRTLVSVNNLANFLVCCVAHPLAAGELFLIGDERAISTKEIVKLLAQGMHKKVWLVPIPPVLARLGAQLIGKQDIYNQLFGSLTVNTDKARRLLQWQATTGTISFF
jgi:UDP-4-keto-D-FucNAc 4-reductase